MIRVISRPSYVAIEWTRAHGVSHQDGGGPDERLSVMSSLNAFRHTPRSVKVLRALMTH